MARSIAILDLAAGISGDMLLGALVDAGYPADRLQELPGRLGFPDVEVGVEAVRRGGVACTKVTVQLPGGAVELPGEFQHHSHDGPLPHHHNDGHGHRHLPDLIGILAAARVEEDVRTNAIAVLRLLAGAEGRVHGLAPEAVALHEVGAVDALVDVVGVLEGLKWLRIGGVHHGPVAVGTGWVRTAHGTVPIPAPATLALLEGLEIGPNGPVTGEAATPTGVALLRTLSLGSPPSRWRPVRTGWGAGTRNPEHYPNAMRLILAESSPEVAEVVTLSTDLDDLSPEYVEPLREALVAAGALDVQVWPTQMKKGRPGIRIEAVCGREHAAAVSEAFFLHSTSAGIRCTDSERVTLPRRVIQVPAGEGLEIGVKVLETPSGPRVKAEYEDVRRVAARLGRPAHEVARDAETEARAKLAAVIPSTEKRA